MAQFEERIWITSRCKVVIVDPRLHRKEQEVFWMKTLATFLGILSLAAFMAACGPDMSAIDASTQKAESDASRAQAAATGAEGAAQQALAASQKADQEAASAQDSVRRANDAVARLEAAFSTSVTK
jgi:hypothetical protein